ncbi:nocobactin polyketide synthase NbtC [Mycobacterium sherrisii]|uniref:nocobactin polyketide synthase NbtC n=1 Tax=Mycobacterium sherrisii TaxID=243061 RepID=UPI003974BA62
MTVCTYRLPDGTIPVLLSANTRELLRDEAAALLSYATNYPEVEPQAIAAMLFRTRTARPHRALVLAGVRADLLAALRAIAGEFDHPSVVRAETPATHRRLAYVFPGQGIQHPGMGRLFYDSVPAFRSEAEHCAQAFEARLGRSPLNYLIDQHIPDDGNALTIQAALFTQMAGLAAMWRSFGITPDITIGHSQGEIAAAYVAGGVSLADAVTVVGLRARAAEEFAPGDYAMAVVATDRHTCADLLARCSGWAELSVINSPGMLGISGERATIQGVVDTLTERGVFARVIDVRFPAHTSRIDTVGDTLLADLQRQLQDRSFPQTSTECFGSTFGAALTAGTPTGQYWFSNLRNIVRFDKAIAAAISRGADTFVELAEHPTLQLPMQDNIAAARTNGNPLVVGTSQRTVTDLTAFTRSLAVLAVHHADYPWSCLRTDTDGPTPLPLLDFPNTRMSETRLWLAGGEQVTGTSPDPNPAAPIARPQLFAEEWVRLSRRSLVPPRTIGFVDYTRAQPDLIAALCAAATDMGATAHPIDGENTGARADLDTLVILLPRSARTDYRAAAEEVTALFSDRTWLPRLAGAGADCWLVTVAGEVVLADDAPPNPVHAAASAGFRSIGAEYPGVGFKHLDLPADLTTPESANAILAAIHTRDEPELARRGDALYAKRLAHRDIPVDSAGVPPDHVLIIGGTGHLGLKFCEHYLRRGARLITLVSRSGATAAVEAGLRQIGSAHANRTQVRVTPCDVRDPAAVAQLARAHHDTPADLIIHAAVDYSAADSPDLTAEQLDRALGAKVVGIAQVLEAYPRSAGCRLLFCSSVAATIGGRGQISYAASNRMLDAMAHELRAGGLDCVSLQWGQWQVHLDLDADVIAQLAAIGVIPMPPADALAVGLAPLRHNAIVMALELDRARLMLEPYGYGPLLSQLTSPAHRAVVAGGPTDVASTVRGILLDTFGVANQDPVDTDLPLVAMGLDSLQALEFRRRVKIALDHELDVADLLGGASLTDIVSRLAQTTQDPP